MSKYVYTVITSSSGADPEVDLVLSTASGSDSAQEVAEDAALAAHSGSDLINSFLVGAGEVEDEITSGAGSSSYFQTTSKNTDDTYTSLRVLCKAQARGLTAYSAVTTYAAGDKREYSSHSYKSLLSTNLNHQPDISATWWRIYDKTPSQVATAAGIAAADADAIGDTCQWLGNTGITIDAS